jgi:hypothetical protein
MEKELWLFLSFFSPANLPANRLEAAFANASQLGG